MKKTYKKPTMAMIEIEDNLLAGSDIMVLSAGNGNDALSKGADDDWDEEDF